MSAAIYDKTGRQIMAGDTLKVFHFIGARRKKYFMFKFVEAVESRPTWNGRNALRISHLNIPNETYLKMCDGKRHEDYEIVQGYAPNGTPFTTRLVQPIEATP